MMKPHPNASLSCTTHFSNDQVSRPMQRSLYTAAALLFLTGCGSGETPATDSTSSSAMPSTSQQAPAADAPADAPMAQVDAIPGAAAPITGAIIEVRLIGDAKGYRFEPQHITAKAGDGVKFVVISGGPHEIAFDLAAIPAQSRNQLQMNMPNSASGRSPLLAGELETWT
ncbi:MAG: hypothetical protein IT360_06795, partial [Gemmatimonadaceae bacterium]|nr:hypothetical protein [Gemmatimonadaceae bacterium]